MPIEGTLRIKKKKTRHQFFRNWNSKKAIEAMARKDSYLSGPWDHPTRLDIEINRAFVFYGTTRFELGLDRKRR